MSTLTSRNVGFLTAALLAAGAAALVLQGGPTMDTNAIAAGAHQTVPVMDRDAPRHFQTATFGLG